MSLIISFDASQQAALCTQESVPAKSADGDRQDHGAITGPSLIIPSDINDQPIWETARLYADILGIPVIPLHPIHSTKAEKPGRQPIFVGYKNLTSVDMTAEYFSEWFPFGTNFNLGAVLQDNLVWADIDAKKDAGISAVAWLDEHEHLKAYPRVRTRNGFHIPVVVPDLPPGKDVRKFIINDSLIIEMLSARHPITLPPSLRLDGSHYMWETVGKIPEMSWDQLLSEFKLQENRKPGRPRKPRPWSEQFRGDLTSLDLQALFGEKNMLGACLDETEGKYAVRCPWEQEHSERHDDITGDAAIWSKEGQFPGFNCFHAHCSERKIKELLEWLESTDPGVVDRFCRRMKSYGATDKTDIESKPLIIHPGYGRLISEVAEEVATSIAERQVWFQRGKAIFAVATDPKNGRLCFRLVTPSNACGDLENYVTPVVKKEVKGKTIQVPLSFAVKDLTPILACPQFAQKLPVIERIIPIRVPIVNNAGEVVYPAMGYDPALHTYLQADAPEVVEMTVDEAKQVIEDILGDFCFASEQDKIHAIARLITPYVRGIIGWTARVPLWLFIANRPRAGKDFLAGVIIIIYNGELLEDAPLEKSSEETRKRITAALMSGRQFMHFANCQGHINDAALIGAITARVLRVRNLGSTSAEADLELPNEIEFSMSANVGVSYREDIEPRTRRINLAFFEEDPNKRQFRRPDLHAYVRENRGRILGAIDALVSEWIRQGMPPGTTPFTSFPEWARVVGGIMKANGLGDPCLPHESDLELGGDLKERAMRAVYRIGFDRWPNQWVTKQELFDALAESDDEDLAWFGHWSGEEGRGTRNKAGMALKAFKGRVLGGIRLDIDEQGKGAKQQVRFHGDSANEGNLGNLGNLADPGPEVENKSTPVVEGHDGVNFHIGGSGGEVSRVSQVSTLDYHLITEPSALAEVAAAVFNAGRVALDTETYGPAKGDALDPRRGRIRLLQLAVVGKAPWLIDLHAVGDDLGALESVLGMVEIVAHNALFDLGFLRERMGITPHRVFCTMTASRLLAAGTKDQCDLFSCLGRYCGIPSYADHGTTDWGGVLSEEQLAYAAADVAHLHDLRMALDTEIVRHGLSCVCNTEMELIPVVACMAAAGLPLDTEAIARQIEHAEQLADTACSRLRAAGGNPVLNPNSPAQVKAALDSAGLSLPNTAQETLASHMDHPFVASLVECRQQGKLASMLAGLRKQLDDDGRLRASFNPLGTCTGRFSSSKPNLQNIPRGAPRTIIVAQPGMRLVRADYSQIELRIVAALANEKRMLQAFRGGQDLHRLTAAFITGKNPEDVTKQERQEAKAVNFGFIYGQGADGFRKKAKADYGLDLTLQRAEELRTAFFSAYPALAAWHKAAWKKVRQGAGETRTRTGRRRLIPSDQSNWNRFTSLVNTPVQGLGADGMKLALIRLHAELPVGSRIILTVHDDVLVECQEADAEGVMALMQRIMTEEMSNLVPEVPIEVEPEVLTSWK
jgi:DNA polymerase-1